MKDSKRLPLDWTKDLRSSEEKESRTKAILNRTNDEVLRVLLKLIKAENERMRNREVNMTNYESPSWAYMQAHYNGGRQALNWIEDLLSFVDLKEK